MRYGEGGMDHTVKTDVPVKKKVSRSKTQVAKKPHPGIEGFLSAESMALIHHALETGIPQEVPSGLSHEEIMKLVLNQK